MDFKNTNSQFVEVPVIGVTSPGNQQLVFNFPNIPYLDYTFIRSIETFTVNDISNAPSNNAVIDAATLKKAFLTLFIIDPKANNGMGGEYIKLVPLVALHRTQNASTDPFVRDLYQMSGQMVSWDKCYITLANAIGNTSNVSFVFNIVFDFNNNKPY